MGREALPLFNSGRPTGGLPGRQVWAGPAIPVCLITGESDEAAPQDEVAKIVEFVQAGQQREVNVSYGIVVQHRRSSGRLSTCEQLAEAEILYTTVRYGKD